MASTPGKKDLPGDVQMVSFPPPDSRKFRLQRDFFKIACRDVAKTTELKCQRQDLNPGFSEAKAHAFNQKALELPQPVVLAHDPFQKWKEHAADWWGQCPKGYRP